MVELTVPGKPQGKQRPRWSRVGMHTPKDTLNYESYIKSLFTIKYPNFTLMEGPLEVEMAVFMGIPSSTSKKKSELMMKCYIRPTKRPDLDNIIKIYCDALESVAYKNDSQIVTYIVSKYYANNPRVEIKIRSAE